MLVHFVVVVVVGGDPKMMIETWEIEMEIVVVIVLLLLFLLPLRRRYRSPCQIISQSWFSYDYTC